MFGKSADFRPVCSGKRFPLTVKTVVIDESHKSVILVRLFCRVDV
jgi:hypothetical protein